MKTTLTVLFVIAMLVATTQTFRHVYVKWIEPTGSVLDEFKDEIDSNIEKAKNLNEVTNLYREAHNKVKEYEANPNNPKIKYEEFNSTEPYKSEIAIKREIQNREYDRKQLFELCFYWSIGLLSVLLGIYVFGKFNQWLGFAGIIVGYSEMLCWTSPLFHTRILSLQFEHLLNFKLAFSLITWLMLIAMWLLIERKRILIIKSK